MKTKNLNKKIGIWAIIIAGLLMIPYITNAPWTSFDYIFAGIVLSALAATFEFLTRNAKGLKPRLIVGAGILVVIVLIIGWAATGPD